MSDSDQPKPKPPVMPTPHTTPDIQESRMDRIMFGAMALFVGIMMICLTILIVYATWLIVTTGGCGSFRK